jgi:ABC-type glycerol-3-phosphate transport system substrate-binding protein
LLSKLHYQKIIFHMISFLVLLSINTSFLDINIGTDAVTSQIDLSGQSQSSYEQYLSKHEKADFPNREVYINMNNYTTSKDMIAENTNFFEGKTGNIVLTGNSGEISWTFIVETEGFYNIGMNYYPMKGNNSSIERELSIDGTVPFDGARSIVFQRIWKDGKSMLDDGRGNEYRPFQIEAPKWIQTVLSGSSGYYLENYRFFFEAGKHILKLKSVKEPLAISEIKLFNESKTINYQSLLQDYSIKDYRSSNKSIYINAEKATNKSDPTLYGFNDRSSPLTEPTNLNKVLLNVIGGYNWRYAKQWIEWEFEAPENGLYKLAMRAMQNFNEGTYSCRNIYIDGEVPFEEARAISFKYDLGWQIIVPGDMKPYLFYLSKGKHIIRLENALGDISEILGILENSIQKLNICYRRILMITGPVPDPNRDYNIDEKLSDYITELDIQSKVLTALAKRLVEITGSKGVDYARIEKLANQISGFVEDPDSIPARLDNFRINLSDSAAWLASASEQPLMLDYLMFLPADSPLPKADSDIMGKFIFEMKMFFTSFISDYNMVGKETDGTKSKNVSLWIGSGRDQAQILKALTVNYFEPIKKIQVDVKLVDMNILLPAVAAGKGPDVAIQQERSLPVNYALRKALYDMSIFPDYKEVLKRFPKSAAESYWIGESIYAIPETQVFPMLFYRTDILIELGLKPPKTWSDFYRIIPVLQKKYLQIGLPNISADALDVFFMFLYQNGGTVYNEQKSRTALDNKISVDAFYKWSELYTKYKIPQQLDITTRFRTGEVPLVLAGYTFYNQLVVAAPEIRGLWDFSPVLGTIRQDGSLSIATICGGTGSIIFKNSKDVESSWEFIKWWTSSDTQQKYGLEIESLQGASARWPTANIDAFDKLSWPTSASNSIKMQRDEVVGLPEVPGSYMLSRYIGSAIRLTINNGYPPRESILDWNKKINEEIVLKRIEFGME